MAKFLKTTVLGGILFLVPIVIFIAIIGKALQITTKLAIPIAGLLGAENIIGIAVAELLSIGILVVACFMAGLAAKTARAKKIVQSLEANVLDKIPVYELLKAKTKSVLSFEDEETLALGMVRFDDSWQLAFEIERIEKDKVVIFLPGAPDPWAGSVCIVTEDRVTPLEMTVNSAVNLMKRLGKGSTDLLKDPKAIKSMT